MKNKTLKYYLSLPYRMEIIPDTDEGGYTVWFPELPGCLTCGDTLEEAMAMAEDLIAGLVLDAMEEGKKIPMASKIEDISLEEYEKELDIEDWNYLSKFKNYISVDISAYAEKWGKQLVKKTVNIPQWVNTQAERMKINFSKTLEEALLEKIYKD